MPTLIIADTTCLVLLEKIGKLEILKNLYGKVTLTSIISKEFKKKIPDWIEITDPKNLTVFNNLSTIVDIGEASAIALSKENNDSILILDDLKARKLAMSLNLKYTGTIGVIIQAKKNGFIQDIDSVIEEIQKTNFRLSNVLIEKLKSFD
jgi:predicted nucleic acid-binding protein